MSCLNYSHAIFYRLWSLRELPGLDSLDCVLKCMLASYLCSHELNKTLTAIYLLRHQRDLNPQPFSLIDKYSTVLWVLICRVHFTVWISLLTLKFQIWHLLQVKSSFVFRQTIECRFILKLVQSMITYSQLICCLSKNFASLFCVNKNLHLHVIIIFWSYCFLFVLIHLGQSMYDPPRLKLIILHIQNIPEK